MEGVRDFEDWLIRHGYAEPSEFALPLISDSEDKNSLMTLDAKRAVQQGKLMMILHQMDMQDAAKSNAPSGSESSFSILGEEQHINLLDSAAGATHGGLSEAGGIDGEFDDPILHALNEIENERTKSTRAGGVSPPMTAENIRAGSISPPKKPQENTPEKEWFRNIPVWFWTLFFSGYVMTVFFAGILFTLLIQLFSTTSNK
jgi:hypothetical protein